MNIALALTMHWLLSELCVHRTEGSVNRDIIVIICKKLRTQIQAAWMHVQNTIAYTNTYANSTYTNTGSVSACTKYNCVHKYIRKKHVHKCRKRECMSKTLRTQIHTQTARTQIQAAWMQTQMLRTQIQAAWKEKGGEELRREGLFQHGQKRSRPFFPSTVGHGGGVMRVLSGGVMRKS